MTSDEQGNQEMKRVEHQARGEILEHSPDGDTRAHPIKLLTTQFIDPGRMKG